MSHNSERIRQIWDDQPTKNIKFSQRPSLDKKDDELKPVFDRFKNVSSRLEDLADFLVFFNKLYLEKYELYGDELLAFIGDKVIRHWPWKDFPFISEEAQKKLKVDITGLTKNDSLSKKQKTKLKNFVYEHWTPMSFFRDAFKIAKANEITLTKQDIYDLLIENYRIVWVTKVENKKLGGKFKSKRKKSTYDKVGIIIFNKALWSKLYNAI